MKNKFAFFSLVLLLIIGIACSEPSTAEKINTVRKEGKSVHDRLPRIKDKRVNEYINNLGKKLDNSVPATAKTIILPINFTVLNTTPRAGVGTMTIGGYVFLERDIIRDSKSEGTIAGVLAHEIAHNYLGHVITTTSYEDCVDTSEECFDEHYKITRTQELEADALAAQMMAKSGYDPEDLAIFFEQLGMKYKKQGRTSYPTHPGLFDRAKQIRQIAKKLPVPKKPTRSTTSLAQAKSILATIKAVLLRA
jgi:predicted Zn-dependent protease